MDAQNNDQDQEIICCEPNCKQPFLFTAGEQAFFAEKGFTPPKRCKPCREAKKAEKQVREAQGGTSAAGSPPSAPPGGGGNENWGNRWEANEGRGGRGRQDDRPRRKRQ